MAILHQKSLQTSYQRQRLTSKAPTRSRQRLVVRAGILEPGATVLVAGATGGVGQLVSAKLIERGFKVKAIARPRSAKALEGYGPNLQVVQADLKDPTAIGSLFGDIEAIVCATGTTAFPSDRWNGDNGPRPTDWEANANLINIAAGAMKASGGDLARFLLVTSAGVERQKELPWAILNLFGVLKYKRDAEELLMKSGLPWTIIRPSRLTDGPYTSFDLNTLLQATAGSRQDVTLSLSDSLAGEASRIAVAEAVVQALTCSQSENKAFALSSKEGEGPGTDETKWKTLFANAQLY
ncbi:nucleoside diphosphate sugar epimerase [Dunaliella salina]|uniref:Nucleoside diphosphate sugar epimerase n=1 Tax=Dunaliella salina TaxID=3046 RepID=A0ABQ7GG86_DUNSA|nr:nucleoside diphosphate sugar epimerase [Dunaliella salina]|eukprot:KAF5833614.1 nucleoside diphosphate sugar epimerase [Dunaliella salina]